MIGVSTVIAQQSALRHVRIGDENIYVAIVIIVAEYRPVTNPLDQHARPAHITDIAESAIPEIAEQLVLLRIGRGGVVFFYILIEGEVIPSSYTWLFYRLPNWL